MNSPYDEIGAEYRSIRSPDIGVAELLTCVQSFNRKISILDLGCGNGYPIATTLIDYASRYVGVDSSSVLIEEFIQNVSTAKAQVACMSDIELNGEQFDLIFAFGSLFHLSPEKQKITLEKAAVAVAENGKLVFTSGDEAGTVEGNVGGHAIPHWSLSKDAYINLLQECGLQFQDLSKGSGDNLFYTFSRLR